MTVKELKAILEKCPENAEVRLENGELVKNPSLIHAPFAYIAEYCLTIK